AGDVPVVVVGLQVERVAVSQQAGQALGDGGPVVGADADVDARVDRGVGDGLAHGDASSASVGWGVEGFVRFAAAQVAQRPQTVSSPVSATKPAPTSGRRRVAAGPSTSVMAPHSRHTAWWWPVVRASKRAAPPAGWTRRARPTPSRAASTS